MGSLRPSIWSLGNLLSRVQILWHPPRIGERLRLAKGRAGTRVVKTPVVGVTPAVLKWARESANMSIDDVARRLKKSADVVSAWESGADAPTYSQLEALAYDIYKRPLALFFLPTHPDEPKPRAEFRSLPDVDLANLSREMTLLIRRARAFQWALIELYGDRSPAASPIWRQIRADP
jgi:transcriptional regulator with XRE-family HTH domain